MEGSIASDENEIAVVEPEVGMASKISLTNIFGRLSRGNNDEWRDAAGDATAFRRPRTESYVTAMKDKKGIRSDSNGETLWRDVFFLSSL